MELIKRLLYTCLAAIIVFYYRYILWLSRVCVCVSVHSFLPPRASIPRNKGMYVFTATRKTLLYIIIVIFAENASFRSYAVICLPRCH